MALEPSGIDFLEARRRLCDGHEDPDVELLEVEISVVRTHGHPHVALIDETWVTCPTCGERVHDDEASETIAQLRRELEAAHAMLRAHRNPGARVVDLKAEATNNG
jgi:hypothetical protein